MENTSNVQLHKIIKNSLASYLSYKWSKNKLYLKKRKNKSQREKRNKEKQPIKLEKKHSIINLENDIFIYDAKTKTFTQLDLCDCFRNGLKYRKIDPFNTLPSKKKYELSQIPKNSTEDSQDFQNFQLTDIEDSVEHIFSNQVIKKGNWEKAINSIYPSKFDFFIQKELKKCNAKNFKAKSFKMNSKQDFESNSKNNIRSSAAIGYYKITTYDNALQCDSNPNNSKDKTKRCNFVGIQKESFDPKKMYSKGLQCKRSNNNNRACKEEKVVSTNETGVQCFIKSPRIIEESKKMEPLDPNIVEILTHYKKSPPPRHKSHKRKKPLRRRSSSLSDLFPSVECKKVRNVIQINSSAEIRKILNEKRSSPSFTLSNTGNYFKTFLSSQYPRKLITFYQTSSSSRDNGGDTYDEQYFKKQHIVVATTSNPISPICSGPCGTRRRQKAASCGCSCGTNYDVKYGSNRYQDDDIQDSRIDQGRRRLTRMTSLQKEESVERKSMEIEEQRSETTKRAESQTDNLDKKDTRTQSDIKHDELDRGPTIKDPSRDVCVSTCNEPCSTKRVASTCSCCHQPILNQKKKECCECPEERKTPQTTKTKCICDILTCLKERIKLQTEEQNRNLDQILEELNKQDQELKEIRNFVEKHNNSKRKSNKYGKVRECSCYAVTVQHDYTTDLTPLPDTIQKNEKADEETSEHVQDPKSSEPEIIELFGSNEKFERKEQKCDLKKDSGKNLWNKNSEVKAFFVTDFLRKRSVKKKSTSSSNSTTEDFESKKNKKEHKHWFSHLFTSKKDLRKNSS